MPKDTKIIFDTITFLESAKRKECYKFKDLYEECIQTKSNMFGYCYVMYMKKFYNCKESYKLKIEKEK